MAPLWVSPSPDFGAQPPCHEFLDRLSGILVFVEDLVYLFRDRELHFVAAGEPDGRQGGIHPFRHHAHAFEDFLEFLPPSELHADRAVSGKIAGAGQHQVAQPGEAGKGSLIGSEGHPQPGHFGQAPGDQRRAGVVPQFETVGYPRSNGNDVLYASA